MLLDNIALFVKIVENGSLAAAARQTGLSPTTVSERLSALETHYGVALLNRTTRSLSLTEEGRTLMLGARQLLDEAADLDGRIRLGAQNLSGLIRLSAPLDLGRTLVSEAIAAFQAEHPGISIDLHLSDGYADIVGLGIDLAVRFGEIGDSTLRVRALPAKPRLVCASPSYIARKGAPETPRDLQQHACILMRFGQSTDNVWKFISGDGKQSVRVDGSLIANDGALVRQWGLEGRGIMLKSEFDVLSDIRSGRLVRLLPEHKTPKQPLQMLFPPGRSQPHRVKVFAEYLATCFKTFD